MLLRTPQRFLAANVSANKMSYKLALLSMERKTEKLITELEKSDSIVDLKEIVDKEHLQIKSFLLEKRTKFHEEESQFSQDIVGGQHFHGELNVEMARRYEEVNYIRNLLKGKIYQMADEQERFNPIKKKILELLNKNN